MDLIPNRRNNHNNQSSDEESGPQLVGERINQIKSDLADKDLSDKQKVIRYGSHLHWFLDKMRALFAYQNMFNQPGVWDVSAYAHGQLNMAIAILAIFMEEQRTPPFKKRPEQYRNSDKDVFIEQAFSHMVDAEKLIAAIVRADEHGPFGYGHLDEPWEQWREEALQLMEEAFAENDEMGRLRERVKDHIDSITEEQKRNNNE